MSTLTSVTADIINLNSQLIDAADAYYKKASPIMSDAAFDALEKQLKQLVKDHPQYASMATYLNKVGSDAKSVSGRIAHRIPMLSIENQYTEDDFLGQFDKFGGVPVCIEPKFDGISVSLTYVDGKLTKALTRGDGESGENMTAQVLLCDIPNQLPTRFAYNNQMYHVPSLVEVRGELVMKNSTLEKLNAKFAASGQKTYSSTRNLTAGTMKLDPVKYADKIREREITIRPWDVIVDGVVASRYARLVMIAQAGFELPEGVIVSKRSDIIPILHKFLAANKRSDVQADGVVMKVDDVPTCRRLGLASKYTNYQTCFKPQDDKAETYVREIMWQIGRTGKLTPVAICDPVNLAGAMITRATINNVTWIKEMGLTIGAKILMLRSGGVIPKIEAVIDPTGTPIVAPTNCPECGKKLDIFDDSTADSTTHIYCTNSSCRGRLIGHFHFIGDREVLEIDGLGPEMAAMLVNGGYANSVADLVDFCDETIAAIDKKGEAAVLKSLQKAGFSSPVIKMARSMQLAKSASWERWIAALGIDMVSDTLGKVIAKEMNLQAGDMVNLETKFRDFTKLVIAGVGPSKKESLLEWLKNPANIAILQRLAAANVRPTPLVAAPKVTNGPLSGIAFCITGEFGEPREIISAKLAKLGAESKSGVSKKCNLLIVGTVPGATKLRDAAKHNVKTVDEKWLRDTLTSNGMTLGASKFAID